MTRRRALTLVLAPPVLALLLAVTVWALALQQSNRADDAAQRLQAALDHRPAEPVVQAAKLLVTGGTAGLASSALQAQVLRLVGGITQVQQIDARGAEAEGPLTRLPVNLRLVGDEPSVMTALIALEQAEPLIFVDALRLSASGASLTVEMDLSAYAGKVTP
ncbi:MAG: GspMb/PilO family protein [Pseudomonadota bacterium]